MGTIQMYGLSTGLGFAGTVERYINRSGDDQLGGIHHAFYLTIGTTAAAVLTALLLIHISQDASEGWGEE